jgi:chromosome partitioning protein
LKIAGLLFNRCKTKEEINGFLADQNLLETKDLVSDTFIPEDEAVKKSIDLKIPLAFYDVKTPASLAYLDFAKEMLMVFK